MKRSWFLFVFFFNVVNPLYAHTLDLIDVFKQSLLSDPTYQQSLSQTLVNFEDVPFQRAALLPKISFSATPSIDKQRASGAIVAQNVFPSSNTFRSFDMRLQLRQRIFNFEHFSKLAQAKTAAKEAGATLNAALQNLMLRVAQAYFTVLLDEENLIYRKVAKVELERQYAEAKEQFKIGARTKTDVYTAKASYGSAHSNYLSARAQLEIDKEFLRTIINISHFNLAKLKGRFPLTTPHPALPDAWAKRAIQQNWTIKANQFALQSAREMVRQRFAKHLPTLDLQMLYDVLNSKSSNSSLFIASGSSKLRNAAVSLNLNVPLFSGGAVNAEVNQARHQLRMAEQKLELSIRNTVYNVHQSFLVLMLAKQKIENDKLTIDSAKLSLQGLKSRYKIGSETLVNVLRQQEKVAEAEVQYATNRYDYIINLLNLKNAAGTLCIEDLEILNGWLRK